MLIKFFKPTTSFKSKQYNAKFSISGFANKKEAQPWSYYAKGSFSELIAELKKEDTSAYHYVRRNMNKAEGSYFFLLVDKTSKNAKYVFATTVDFLTVDVTWKENGKMQTVTFGTTQRADAEKLHIFEVDTAKSVRVIKIEEELKADAEINPEELSHEELIALFKKQSAQLKNAEAKIAAQAEQLAVQENTINTLTEEVERVKQVSNKHFARLKEKEQIIARLETFNPVAIKETTASIRAEREHFIKTEGKRIYIANESCKTLVSPKTVVEEYEAQGIGYMLTEE